MTTSSWRNPCWRYHGAASHASGDGFRRRQRERMRAVEAERKIAAAAPAKIRSIKAAGK